MKSTTKYLIGVVAVVLVIAVIAAFGMRRTDSNTDDGTAPATDAPQSDTVQTSGEAEAQQPAETEDPTVLPTFMYFVSKSDESYDAAKAVYDELEAEYSGRVKFDLKDVDAEPDLKERFMINQEDSPIPMKTPTLIMLDVHNNISTIGLSECTDKATLKQAIEKALAA
jgi:ABC-type transport system substrate-binding protein